MQELRDILNSAKKIAIMGHMFPDGDAMGAMLGLHFLLKKNFPNIQTTPVIFGDPGYAFSFLEGFSQIQNSFDPKDFDVLILVDTPVPKQIGYTQEEAEKIKEQITIVSFDHHVASLEHTIPHLNIVDVHLASTTQIIYNLAKTLDWKIPPQTANAFLTGLMTDTGGFMHPNVTSAVFSMAADLMALGANHVQITKEVFKTRSQEYIGKFGELMNRIEVFDNFAFLTITSDDALSKDEDTRLLKTELVSIMSNLKGVDYSCVLQQNGPGFIRGSFRASGEIDVNKIANHFDGGGHIKAAGFKLQGDLEQEGIVMNGTIKTYIDFIKEIQIHA